MLKQFVALSGLPRTGSTLLSAILSQNPNIHAEGDSAVCQLMWDMQQSVVHSSQIKANNKNVLDSLVRQIPHIYYANVTKPIVVDKCRSWTLPANIKMLKQYFDQPPKCIVLLRPLVEIVGSFVALRIKNGWIEPEQGLLDDGSEPIMRSLFGVNWAKNNNNGEFLFVTYDEIVDNTQTTLNRIYEFCNWEPFVHNLSNIVCNHKEDDTVYGLNSMHDIRSKITRRVLDVELSKNLIEKCNSLNLII